MRLHLTATLACLSVIAVGCATAVEQPKAEPSPCLRMELQPLPADTVAPGNLPLNYEVRNTCSRDIAFCKPIDVGCYSAWTDAQGVQHGALGGWPHDYQCPVDRLAKLGANETLQGTVTFALGGVPADRVAIHCVFQADGSGTFGSLPLWVGRISSNWVEVRLP